MAEIASGMSAAISAYNRAAAKANEAPDVNAGAGGGSDGEFASLVRSAIQEAQVIGGTAEKATMAGVTGAADLSQVVTAVAEAEVALQTVVSIRDKVLEAYKDITRMPI